MANSAKELPVLAFELFVGVTILPIWKQPPRTPEEVRERAQLKMWFLEASASVAEELKREILAARQR